MRPFREGFREFLNFAGMIKYNLSHPCFVLTNKTYMFSRKTILLQGFFGLLTLFFSCIALSAQDFRVAFVGDPQVDDSLEMDFARRTIYRELRESRDIDFALIMGDIVNEKPELLSPSKASLDSLPFPYLCIPGNHDRGRAFNDVFGYGDTTFVCPNKGVRFVLMNNILSGFSGGFRSEQLEWLRGVVGRCGKRERLVLALHVPLRYCEGRDSVLSILSAHPKTLFVSAHLHRVFRDDVSLPGGSQVEEIGVGATCGSWWRGLEEPVLVEGSDTVWTRGTVPNARMNCGAPRGYFVTTFKSDGSYSSRYKRVGRDASDVASVRIVGDSLYVNVYGGHEKGKVALELRGEKRKLECTRTGSTAPEVQEIIDYNASVPRKERRSRKRDFIPMRRLSSQHLWVCALPEALRGQSLSVKVKYSDPTMRFSLKTKAE